MLAVSSLLILPTSLCFFNSFLCTVQVNMLHCRIRRSTIFTPSDHQITHTQVMKLQNKDHVLIKIHCKMLVNMRLGHTRRPYLITKMHPDYQSSDADSDADNFEILGKPWALNFHSFYKRIDKHRFITGMRGID